MYVAHMNMSLSNLKNNLNNLNQIKPSSSFTSFIPGRKQLFIKTVMPPECLIAFSCFGLT